MRIKKDLIKNILGKVNKIESKKQPFNKGDSVKLTLKGLQKFNKGRILTGPSNNYSRELGKLYDKKEVGKVERVFPSGSMNVRFGKALFDIKPYMVEAA